MVVAALRKRIEVRRLVRTSDGMGGFTESEQSQGLARGRIVALRQVVDPTVAERLGGRPPYQIVLDERVGPAVQASDILVDGKGRRYVVVAVSHQGRVTFVTAAEV